MNATQRFTTCISFHMLPGSGFNAWFKILTLQKLQFYVHYNVILKM